MQERTPERSGRNHGPTSWCRCLRPTTVGCSNTSTPVPRRPTQAPMQRASLMLPSMRPSTRRPARRRRRSPRHPRRSQRHRPPSRRHRRPRRRPARCPARRIRRPHRRHHLRPCRLQSPMQGSRTPPHSKATRAPTRSHHLRERGLRAFAVGPTRRFVNDHAAFRGLVAELENAPQRRNFPRAHASK